MNNRNNFEIPALLSCQNEEIHSRKIQNHYIILNFPALDFLVMVKIKEQEFHKYFCRFLSYFHIGILFD